MLRNTFWWRAKLFFGKTPFKWVQRFFFDAQRAGGPGLVDGPPQAADRGVSRGQRLGAAHREAALSHLAETALSVHVIAPQYAPPLRPQYAPITQMGAAETHLTVTEGVLCHGA